MSKRIEFINIEEFGKLYKAEKDKTMKLVLSLGFGSGLRISEIIGLEKEISRCCKADIEREKREINNKKIQVLVCSKCKKNVLVKDIRRRKGDWQIFPLNSDMINLKESKINLTNAKGGKWRTINTPPNMKEEHLKLLPIKIERRTLQYRFKALAKKVLNKNMSIHVLRHGYGNFLVNVKNVPLPIVQQLMGHSKIDTTGIYTKANPDESIKAVIKAWGEE